VCLRADEFGRTFGELDGNLFERGG
jgi:hypothetical protein